MEYQNDVVIIGAGASGLMAGLELAMAGRKVLILEARDRPGGRMHTLQVSNFNSPIELGAEFIHGKLELTLRLLDKAGISYSLVNGDAWQKKDNRLCKQEDFIEGFDLLQKKFKQVSADISVADFIKDYLSDPGLDNLRFTVKNYVEGYYAADLNKASTFALRDELTQSDDEQYRIEGGYIKLIDYLIKEFSDKGGQIRYNHKVVEVNWGSERINAKTAESDFQCDQILVTLPLGLLQNNTLPFYPALPEKMEASRKLGSGKVIKILLLFKEAFWHWPELTQGNDLSKLGFMFSKEKIPTWWTQYPDTKTLLTGWLGGPHAAELEERTEEEIIDIAVQSLASIFEMEKKALQELLIATKSVNWIKEPFTQGGYAYEVVNGPEIRKEAAEPVQNRIYFAGEALYNGPEIGTVEAALYSGRETAQLMIAGSKTEA